MIEPNSTRGKEMMTYAPNYYENSRVYVKGVIEPQGKEFDEVNAAIMSVFDQFFVRRATYMLDLWEQEYGLPLQALTDNERRDRIVGKIRGNGTATIRLVKNTAESYQNGEVSVMQDDDHSLVIIRFVGVMGIPSNMDDLQQVIRDIVPAHLDITYEYTFLIWDDIDKLNWQWDTWDAKNLTWKELEVL